nr:putative ribonuclease H-like domain-containing protein [Tanacetum cinerariifolium]
FEDPDHPDKVYKVAKALYGLHQAPRAWYENLANYLLENGFQRGKIDQTLFIKRQKEQKKDEIFISQDKYVAEILRKFRLTDGKSVSTPIDTKKPLLKDPDGCSKWNRVFEKDVTCSKYLKCWLPHYTPNGSQFTMSKPHQELASPDQTVSGVNTPRCDEDRLELMELMVFLLPKVEKVGIGVSAVDLQVSAVRLMLLLLVHKFVLFGLTNWCCSLSVVSEGFNQIIDFLNRSSIKYALTVNPNIYVSCIKQFWTTVAVKKVNGVIRLQALVDKKKVAITEATIREALCLDDAEGVECLPNEEIFAELARMGYEKPSIKLTFYKAFFSSQLKFLIHTILQCISAKRTSWNEFSSSMASAVICLSTEQQVAKEGDAKVHGEEVNAGDVTEGDVSAAHEEVPTTDQGFSVVKTPLFEGMLVEQQVAKKGDVKVYGEEVNAGDVTEGDVSAAHGEVPAADEEPSILSPTPPTPPPQPSHDIPSTSQVQPTPPQSPQGRMIAEMDQDADVVLEDDKEVADEAKREDLEALWSLVKERFSTTKLKNFFDDFLLMTVGEMFEKLDIHAQFWKNQRSVHGPTKVKGWKLLESCGV